jgi:uncharacterized protein
VNDDAEILRPEVRQRIEERLAAHEGRTGNQVVVLTVPTLDGESVDQYAGEVFETWGLGQRGRDNGVLLVVVPQDRRMRIEVGYGLEDVLTDLKAGRIIRNVIAPLFQAEDFDGGIEAGIGAILTTLEGGEVPDLEVRAPAPTKTSSDSFFEGPDLPIAERILLGAFIFGIIGLFTIIGIGTPGVGWFLYLFLIPFWAMFPIVVVGTHGALVLLGAYVVGFPVAKLVVRRTDWYAKARQEIQRKGHAAIGGFTIGSSRGSGSWSSGGSRSSGGGFSGGGGSSGGGGASGGW